MAKKTRTKRAPENENKSEKFRRLANQRLPRAVAAIASLAKLASGGYEFTPVQADMIVATLQDRVEGVKVAFAGGLDTNIPVL